MQNPNKAIPDAELDQNVTGSVCRVAKRLLLSKKVIIEIVISDFISWGLVFFFFLEVLETGDMLSHFRHVLSPSPVHFRHSVGEGYK